jgi:tetratricopeptide (TPR) repeat protein
MTRKLRRLRRRLLEAGSRGAGLWLAGVLNAGGGLHERRGAYGLAEKHYRESIRILERAGGRPDGAAALIQSLGRLALVLRARARYDGAERLLRRAVAIAEKTLGAEDQKVADLLNDLGVVHKRQERFADAEAAYRRALSISEKSLGPDHPAVATLYHNLGKLEHARGRYALGEPLARRSLAINRKALGVDHPHVANDAAALASILERLGRHEEAATLYRWALPIVERQHTTGSLFPKTLD